MEQNEGDGGINVSGGSVHAQGDVVAGHKFELKVENSSPADRARARRAAFENIERLMPALIQEMRDDLRNDETQLVREFRVMIREGLPLFGGGSKRRFAYYRETHKELDNMLDFIKRAGFIHKVEWGDFPIYEFTEEFVEFLKASQEE